MAQYFTLLPLLLIVALFNPTVCANGLMYSGRRDRAPYIDSGDYSSQYLADFNGPVGGRLGKTPVHRADSVTYSIQAQIEPPLPYTLHEPEKSEQVTTDSIVDKNIRSVFATNFGPGLYLFKDPTHLSPVDNNQKDNHGDFHTEQPQKQDINYSVDSSDCIEKEGAKNGKPFCTNLRNYPEKSHLEQIIKQRFSNLESFFGEDLVLPQNISQRMNNEPSEEFLCKSRTRVIYPQAGLNKDYNWLIIVNIPNYKQGIRIEECINEGSTCGESNGLSLPNRYTATCKQSYIYRSLVAYTNDTVIKDQFKMPSCCKCVLRTG